MRTLILFLAFCWGTTICLAEEKTDELRIDGASTDRFVTEISYDGDKITLSWNDKTVVSDWMARAIANLISGIDLDKVKIRSICGLHGKVLNVEGTSPGQLLCVYDIQGKVTQSILVNSVSCQLDISNLNTGIYLLKAGYEIIKFVKK
ncbi:T9SS type A sorting domain-containing protein [Hoylesella pleuritidis]|jgi:hypothetical protein|uniref:Por secretion system C-terminal sorting domain protein n=1 Tax=Hoylesella pleuritidis F0068 TaxID=1081904 RepID=U2L439_9BACT|nr:T9SS type A sorting domain-containing protein [Hoylesella pleuritidis]ERJ99095.1 Por secretion system C-terminal sorting domain protein [Hoylesella pleuritidis F0068]